MMEYRLILSDFSCYLVYRLVVQTLHSGDRATLVILLVNLLLLESLSQSTISIFVLENNLIPIRTSNKLNMFIFEMMNI